MSAVKKLVMEMMGFSSKRTISVSPKHSHTPSTIEEIEARLAQVSQSESLLAEEDGTQNAQVPPPASPPSTPDRWGEYLTPEALAFNEARLCHLASLGLDLRNKRVLEIGGGIGLHTCFFESLGCNVLFAESRQDCLDEVKKRYPHRKTARIELDAGADLSHWGTFDLVYCHGTIDNATSLFDLLRSLSNQCRELMLVEMAVALDADEPNQAGLPHRSQVLSELRSHMGFAYQTVTQPNHSDFELNWIQPSAKKTYRSVFVGSKTELDNPLLSEQPCAVQAAVPQSDSGVWFDVGAHLGGTSFSKAESNPNLRVIAFEPNIALASQTFQRLPNFQILPVAIGEQTGFTTFHLNAFAAASSLLPMDESARQKWIGGEVLCQDAEIIVPVMRLDDVMKGLNIQKVDLLKIDAQGADLAVVKSLGDRIKDVRKIKLEVTTTAQQLYVGTATKNEIIEYLANRGFALISEQSQTHGQEENLLFFQLGPWPHDESTASPLQSASDERKLRNALLELQPDRLVSLAQTQAAKSVMQRKSDWSFGSYAKDWSLANRLRQILCSVFQERKLTEPVLFHWYDHLRLHLYLGNDSSLPTYVSGVIDPNEFYFLHTFLEKGMTFVDIGANEGFYSIFASDRVGEYGRVIAFEPSQREADRLLRNLALNKVSNTTLENIGVADMEGEAILKLCEYGHEGQNTLGDFAHPVHQEGTQTIPLIRLDSYFDGHPIDRIDLIKIDVEGAEERVLRGASQTLDRFRPVLLMEMNDRSLQMQGSSCHRVASLLQSTGYCIYSFDAATGRLAPSEEGRYSDNVVAVPREKVTRIERVR